MIWIERFELRAFGPFTGRTLDLTGARAGHLHLVGGPNEAGKSTAQRGIGDFLFGIPTRTTDNQLHDYGSLRLAATVRGPGGERIELVRRKGVRSTLLDPAGDPVDEQALAVLLGGVTREVFESMFSITHESLVRGAKALLDADGNLGESLYSASLGAAGLHALRSELDELGGRIFRPRATTNSLLHQARAAYEAAEAEFRELTLRTTTFTDHQRATETAEGERSDLAAAIARRRAELAGHRRLRAAIPHIARRAELLEELERLGSVPNLPADARERRVRATERLAAGRRAAAAVDERVEQLRARRERIEVAELVLAHAEEIKALHGRLGTAGEGREDLARQRAKRETADTQARAALAAIRPDLTLEEAGHLRLSEAVRSRLEAMLDGHGALAARLADGEEALAEATRRRHAADRTLARSAAPAGLEELSAALAAVTAGGPIEAQIDEQQSELSEHEQAAANELAGLAPAVASVDALRSIPVPAPEALEQFSGQAERLEEESGRLDADLERHGLARRELEEDRGRLALSDDVPTVAQLEKARAERDRDWSAVRELLAQPAEPAAETGAIAARYEGGVGRADSIADRLRNEADTVARQAELAVRERRLAADTEALDERAARLAGRRAEFGERWGAAWADAPFEPAGPAQMIGWCARRAAVLERDRVRMRHESRLASLRATRDQHRGRLATLIAAASGAQPRAATATLAELASVARGLLDRSAEQAAEHRAAVAELEAATSAEAERAAELHELRVAAERRQEQWELLVNQAGWPSPVEPGGARALLARVDELFRRVDESAVLERRIEGIGARLEEFERETRALVGRVAPALAGRDARDAVAELDRTLTAAAQARASRDALDRQIESEQDEADRLRLSLDEAERELATLVELAGVDTVEELPATEERCLRAAALHTELPELEAQITLTGEAPLAQLVEQAAGADLAQLEAAIAGADEEIERLAERLREIDERIGELRRERDLMNDTAAATTAAERSEQRLAEVRALAERYLRLHLSAWALRQAIDAYRREHKTPLLERANELFPQLTGGSFTGLEVNYGDDDEPILVGRRREGGAAGGAEVPVARMSTGTREQLYLALRLASLERHVETHGAMPVILDDVVLHSDPARQAAIFRAVGELARVTQVIVFTHDPNVIEVARAAVDAGVLTVHELDTRPPAQPQLPAVRLADAA